MPEYPYEKKIIGRWSQDAKPLEGEFKIYTQNHHHNSHLTLIIHAGMD